MVRQFSLKAVRILFPLILHMLAAVLTGELLSFFRVGLSPVWIAVAADGICIPVFLYLYRKRKPEYDYRKITKPHGKPLLFAAAFLSGAAASILSNRIIDIAGLTEHFPSAILGELQKLPFMMQIAGLSVIVPVAEELLYRGLVRNEIRLFTGRRVSALVSAALFAIGHGNILQALFAFPMGLWLAFCQDFGGIGAAIACHIGYNLASAAAAALFH